MGAGLLPPSAGAFPRLRAGVQVFAAPLLLGRLQQLNKHKTKDRRGIKTTALKRKIRKSIQHPSDRHLLRRDGRGSSGYGLQHRPQLRHRGDGDGNDGFRNVSRLWKRSKHTSQINSRNKICMRSSSITQNYERHELKTTLRSLICGSRPKTPPTELLQYRQRQTVGSSAGRGLVSVAAEVEFSAA